MTVSLSRAGHPRNCWHVLRRGSRNWQPVKGLCELVHLMNDDLDGCGVDRTLFFGIFWGVSECLLRSYPLQRPYDSAMLVCTYHPIDGLCNVYQPWPVQGEMNGKLIVARLTRDPGRRSEWKWTAGTARLGHGRLHAWLDGRRFPILR